MTFYEVFWYGEHIGEGGDLEEALQSYQAVKPKDSDWPKACSPEEANPYVNRYASFDDYLDNADSLEMIHISPSMISEALNQSFD